MATQKSGEEARGSKVSEANLGQKKAEREKAAKKEFRHMGTDEKAKWSEQQEKK